MGDLARMSMIRNPRLRATQCVQQLLSGARANVISTVQGQIDTRFLLIWEQVKRFRMACRGKSAMRTRQDLATTVVTIRRFTSHWSNTGVALEFSASESEKALGVGASTTFSIMVQPPCWMRLYLAQFASP